MYREMIMPMWVAFLDHLPSIIAAVLAGLALWSSQRNSKKLVEANSKLEENQVTVDRVHSLVNDHMGKITWTLDKIEQKIPPKEKV